MSSFNIEGNFSATASPASSSSAGATGQARIAPDNGDSFSPATPAVVQLPATVSRARAVYNANFPGVIGEDWFATVNGSQVGNDFNLTDGSTVVFQAPAKRRG